MKKVTFAILVAIFTAVMFSCNNNGKDSAETTPADSADATAKIPFEEVSRDIALADIKRYDTFYKHCPSPDTMRYKPDEMAIRLISLTSKTIDAIKKGKKPDRIRFCVALYSSQQLTVYIQLKVGTTFSYYDMKKPKAVTEADDRFCPPPTNCVSEGIEDGFLYNRITLNHLTMKNVILLVAAGIFIYGCVEISGKERNTDEKETPGYQLSNDLSNAPPEALRVGREEAKRMRARRSDDATIKISAKDLQSLMTSAPAESDSFIFYFVKYDKKSESDRERYLRKNPKANWDEVGKRPSSVLVGFIGGGNPTMDLTKRFFSKIVPVYDLGVVCPPPANCDCEIAQ